MNRPTEDRTALARHPDTPILDASIQLAAPPVFEVERIEIIE